MLFEEKSHSGWIQEYDLQRFFARRSLERSLGRHIRGRITAIGEEYQWDQGGGMCSEGRLVVEIIQEEEIETTDAESSGVEEVPEYSSQSRYHLRARGQST